MATINRITHIVCSRLSKRSITPLNNVWSRHHLSTSSSLLRKVENGDDRNVMNVPISQPLPWLPTPKFATVNTQDHETKITVLDNGLRVATQPNFGMFCTVGVLIDSGSRYEVNNTNGIGHFLEKLSFSSTTKFANKDSINQTLAQHGGVCDCQGSRDVLIYAASASVDGVSEVTEVLSEAILKPNITYDEVERAREIIQFELDYMDIDPNPEPFLNELVHSAAFQNNTLGLSKTCLPENVALINRSSILNYLNQYFTPDRMVLAGVGVDHEEFVNLARKYFTVEPSWSKESCVTSRPSERDVSVAQYTGGMKKVVKDLSDVSLGPNKIPEFAHLVIGMEGVSLKSDDFVASCVLSTLLGGGGSFSAGGPGKGMYSRMYLNVLNQHHWINSATAINHVYNDAGLFCVVASAQPGSLKELTEVIIKELVNTQGKITKEELNRAKAQIQSLLLMNLESRPVIFEDVGRQVLASGKRMLPEHFLDLIQKVSENDLHRLVKRMLSSKPSVAALGNLDELPTYEEIRKAINNGSPSSMRFKLFRS